MKEPKENLSGQATLDHIKPCWYWDKKDLAHTPSQSEGLDPGTEARYRREGARFIFDVGTRLGLHYDTLATGIIYFHRFYMFHSFKQFPRYVTGACCLFLAGKVEETPKKCKDIIKTARSLLNDVQFAQFGDDPKEEVMVLERILLQTIKFDLQVEHPYMFLLRYVKQLKGEKNKVCKVLQMAWTFVNDSLCTMLSLQWEPEIIAVAVMYLAGRLCKFDIQEWTAKQSSRRWWEQFVQDVPVELLEDICHQILDLYSQGNKPIPQQIQEKERAPATPTSLPPVPQGQPPASNPPPPPPKKASPQVGSPARQLKRSHTSPKDEPKPPGLAKVTAVCFPPKYSVCAQSPLDPEKKTTKLYAEFYVSISHEIPVRYIASSPAVSSGSWSSPKLLACLYKIHILLPEFPHPAPPAEAEPGSEAAPPPPHNYLMSTTSSYMSGEGYQSLQSMMKTEGPAYTPMPPTYPPPIPPYHPHVYQQAAAPPPGPPPPPSSYPPPSLAPAYPPPGYNSYPPPPPPRMPPGHVPPPGITLPPAGYPPPPPVPPGQSQVPLPPPPGMPLNRGGWMR
uniref:Cyclin-K n=1 Tax=Poecilia formosa TaxID=48698 RepID=A0A087XCE2_POEFO